MEQQSVRDRQEHRAWMSALGESWGLPVCVAAIRTYISTLDDSVSKQWLVKARGGL